ncbi:MAG: hypothetical protein ACE3L7_33575 [Candidatus Pristimantibacillus sp.]
MGLDEVKRLFNEIKNYDDIRMRLSGYMWIDDQLMIEHHLLGVPLNQEELLLMAESTRHMDDLLDQKIFQLDYPEFSEFLDYARSKASLPKMYSEMTEYSYLVKKANPKGYVPSGKAQAIIIAIFALIVLTYIIIVRFLEPIQSYIALGFTYAAVITFYLMFNKVRRVDQAKDELKSLKKSILASRERRLDAYL